MVAGGKRLADHPLYGLMIAAAYGVVSITITLFNKAVFSMYKFKFPITLFLAQMIFSLIFVNLLKLVSPDRFGFPGPELKMARKLLPMALGWVTYGVSGVIALKYLNVPMFSAFRRFTTLIVMYGEYKLRGRLPPRDQIYSVLLMSVGAAVAGFTDLAFSLPGYFWVITCAISTALYLLFIDKLGRESGLNDFGLLFYNNLLSFPFMLAALFISGEHIEVWKYERLYDLDFQIFFVISAMQAFFLNFLIFFCTRINSPLITSITGTVKDLVTNALGMTLFGDFPFNIPNFASICICFLASVWYSRLKYLASKPKPVDTKDEKETAVAVAMEEGKSEAAEATGHAPQVPAGLSDLLQNKENQGASTAAMPQVTPAAPPAPVPAPAAPKVDAELLERKRALERQLRELEQQMQSSNTHHND